MLINEKKFLVSTQCTDRLMKPIQRTNRNVTTEKWFSCVKFIVELARRKLNYIYVYVKFLSVSVLSVWFLSTYRCSEEEEWTKQTNVRFTHAVDEGEDGLW